MLKKLDKIIGLKKTDFDLFVEKKVITLREARLIPSLKVGDEMALTSVILSSIRLIKEFRKMIFASIKMMTGGTLYAYTEVGFNDEKDSRLDGLIIVVKGGTIKDAAIFEMKNGNSELQSEQISKYLKIAQKLGIEKLITVSNQYVSEPSQFPLNIKPPKTITLFHFSWSYLLTIAHILLFDNDLNIEDSDQVEIMKEVVFYIENEKSGVSGFTQMKAGWKEIVEKINAGATIKLSDSDLDDTVISWQQEEKDMALILSKKLGIFVSTGDSKFRNNLHARIDNDKHNLLKNKRLESSLKVKGAVSDLKINTRFDKRIVEMSVCLKAPVGKTTRGQLGWMKKQFDNCFKKSQEEFQKISKELFVDISIKNYSNSERILFSEIDSIFSELKTKEIKDFEIIYVKDFGKQFSNRKNFVKIIEEMLINFYTGVVQNLTKYEAPAPKINDNREFKNIDNVESEMDVVIAARTKDTSSQI